MPLKKRTYIPAAEKLNAFLYNHHPSRSQRPANQTPGSSTARLSCSL